MMKDIFAGKFFDSRIHSEKVGKKEKYLGHFLGPIIGAFPIIAKTLDVLTFIYMGHVVDGTKSRQGKARPWKKFYDFLRYRDTGSRLSGYIWTAVPV